MANAVELDKRKREEYYAQIIQLPKATVEAMLSIEKSFALHNMAYSAEE